MKTTLLFLLLIFMTCKAQKNGKGSIDGPDRLKQTHGVDDPDRTHGHPSNPSLELVTVDPYSGTEVAETLIIKDAKRLQKFYSQINLTRKPGLSVPDIDFSKEMVIIRCSGISNELAVPQLFIREVTNNAILLGMEKTDKDSSVFGVTTPFSVYRMPLTTKQVILKE